ncbi:MAG: zinc-finger domain-containing protein [Alphaproteobacteria bacterium]
MAHEQEMISCDGGGGALGHPLVYYEFGNKNSITCNYCGKTFHMHHDNDQPIATPITHPTAI